MNIQEKKSGQKDEKSSGTEKNQSGYLKRFFPGFRFSF